MWITLWTTPLSVDNSAKTGETLWISMAKKEKPEARERSASGFGLGLLVVLGKVLPLLVKIKMPIEGIRFL